MAKIIIPITKSFPPGVGVTGTGTGTGGLGATGLVPAGSIPNTPVVPPADYAYSTPQIVVEIYSHSGGKLTMTGGNAGILQASIEKNIRNKEGGRFNLLLAPGGPGGVDDSTTWVNLVNPNSLAVIALSRGGSQRIVMVGVVTSIEEDQVWHKKEVIRVTRIAGIDFTYYFTSFSFYQLTFLGLVQSIVPGGAAAYLLGQWSKIYQGTPDEVANSALQFVMLGQGSTDPGKVAVLDNTYVFYKNQQRVFLRQIYSSWFQSFAVNIPLQADLINAEGSWMDKFLAYMQWPFYEFFIATAEAGDYPIVSGSGFTSTATVPITVDGYPNVSPTVIGRLNPLPWVQFPSSPVSTATSGTVSNTVPQSIPNNPVLQNYDVWNALTLFSLGTYSFIESKVKYGCEDVANLFTLSLVDSNQIAAGTGTSPTVVAQEYLGTVLDGYSINEFGYRPKFLDCNWLTWGATPLPDTPNQFGIASMLLGMLGSYYIPTPQMLFGSVTIPMWPDIIPGCRFIYNPFKVSADPSDPYMFYIEAVTHNYTFGGSCTTEIGIDRGLKQSEYADTTLLTNILIDAVVRTDGVFTARTDLVNNNAAFHINPSSVSKYNGPGGSSYGGPPPNVTAGLHGFPAGATTMFDPLFSAAAAPDVTPCAGHNNQITPNLLKGIAMRESSLNPNAQNSTSGAAGLMQIKPSNVPPGANVFDPATNIALGAGVLCEMLQKYGDINDALAHYGGYVGGYDEPGAAGYVDQIKKYADTAPTLVP